MDNFHSGGAENSDDLFGFIPPNMMFPERSDAAVRDTFSSKEEMERYFYHLEHDNELHLRDSLGNTDNY